MQFPLLLVFPGWFMHYDCKTFIFHHYTLANEDAEDWSLFGWTTDDDTSSCHDTASHLHPLTTMTTINSRRQLLFLLLRQKTLLQWFSFYSISTTTSWKTRYYWRLTTILTTLLLELTNGFHCSISLLILWRTWIFIVSDLHPLPRVVSWQFIWLLWADGMDVFQVYCWV